MATEANPKTSNVKTYKANENLEHRRLQCSPIKHSKSNLHMIALSRTADRSSAAFTNLDQTLWAPRRLEVIGTSGAPNHTQGRIEGWYA